MGSEWRWRRCCRRWLGLNLAGMGDLLRPVSKGRVVVAGFVGGGYDFVLGGAGKHGGRRLGRSLRGGCV